MIGLGEDLLDALVDLTNNVHQIALGALEVLQLLGQELVAFLQRGILLQREGVDPAQGGELALGGAQAFGLDVAHVGDGHGCPARLRGVRVRGLRVRGLRVGGVG